MIKNYDQKYIRGEGKKAEKSVLYNRECKKIITNRKFEYEKLIEVHFSRHLILIITKVNGNIIRDALLYIYWCLWWLSSTTGVNVTRFSSSKIRLSKMLEPVIVIVLLRTVELLPITLQAVPKIHK